MTTVDDDITRLRTATREAHEAAQNLREAAREVRDAVTLANTTARKIVDDAIGEQVAAGLADYRNVLDRHIEDATQRVDARFDMIADVLLGEDAKAKGVPMIEYAQRIAERHRMAARRVLDEPTDDPGGTT